MQTTAPMPPNEVVAIRTATVADASDVAHMVAALLEEIMAAIGNAAFCFDLAETEARLSTYIEQAKYFVFVARDGEGTACGFIALHESHALYAEGAFGTIPELFVHPSWRSTTVGSQLIAAARQLAIDKGWRRLEVTTPPLPQFQRTLDFYERQGFSLSGGRKLKTDLA
ncbi:MAG TPA: GNAT family N-acetyltransferase [Candidatus Aquabacterium excrementipullorum]|nr:GNAT family N-acetyltransferase [Candidatus Aquabacterium excrementipullorum]